MWGDAPCGVVFELEAERDAIDTGEVARVPVLQAVIELLVSPRRLLLPVCAKHFTLVVSGLWLVDRQAVSGMRSPCS